jgi:hypothetical protein
MAARWGCSRNSTARRGWPALGRRSSRRAGVGRIGSGLELDCVGDSFLCLGMEGKDQRVPWKSFERGGERRGGRTPWMGERRHGSRSSCWLRPWEEGPWRALEGSREGTELEGQVRPWQDPASNPTHEQKGLWRAATGGHRCHGCRVGVTAEEEILLASWIR